jgi:ATP phosphoribosyltransferase regulatory subunit
MTAETARKFEALEAQAQKLLAVFTAAGYEAVAPSIIQPADVFLDVIGESLRARTYVFTDPDGEELCLRPDLTVPTCRLHLERHGGAGMTARYCYNGPAFRYQPVGAGAAHPREFRQAGIECFGEADREQADAEVVSLILQALAASGLTGTTLRMGDLGLFHALLDAIEMPERWRHRLRHFFWRPDAFRAELQRLTTNPAVALEGLPRDLAAALDPGDLERSEALVEAHLEQNGLPHIGTRSIGEITLGLIEAVEDAKTQPLPVSAAQLIEDYLRVRVPAREVPEQVGRLAARAHIDLDRALSSYRARTAALEARGVGLGEVAFSAEFGRSLEYYTGFVFEVVFPRLGPASPLSGGGRYDRLLKQVGAPADVPAVGAMIHTERLLAALDGEAR